MSSQQTNIEKSKMWQARIRQQQSSGLPIKQFCNDQRWNIHTFMYWKKKFSKSGDDLIPCKKFVSVSVSSSVREHRVRSRIELPNGVAVELGDDLGGADVGSFIRSLCGINPTSERRMP